MYIKTTHSTNTLLKELIAKGEEPKFIYAGYQTAGRGQTGNSWESEEGKNLLCSVLLPPRKNLFELNVAVSVAVRRVVGYLENEVVICLHCRYKKVAGILIENAIIGNEVKYSIAGIGLNVNQTEFVSDAPNPISMKQIYGTDFAVDELMEKLYAEVQRALDEDVWAEYKAHLYRREGFWRFVERPVSIEPTMNANSQEPIADSFMARIKDILPTGEIVLQDQEGKERKYHFKQIRYVV